MRIFDNISFPEKPRDRISVAWRPTVHHFRDGMEFELHVRVALERMSPSTPHFFSITCMEYHVIDGMIADDGYGHAGSCHEYIGKFFPELVPYFDLHLKNRFGMDFFDNGEEKEIVDPFYTDEDKQAVRAVEHRVRLRKYLHARELIELIRSKSQQP